ncbi:prenyltransferase/squalene oxidase repeat-containing protein [Phytomonospora endophytica]|uniref:Squalene cyclase C-terminal domain-containing protein n=1 Tax=Phytomonospora endophytica TaxID=714109 RepID=A0A841FDE6_9ACTN|nr:prenyltransferase/squalene oxidase repeat-containing protein [Phytomonospora endophytica]MBB6034306.1 hypothetical protein [Phytomonospora endophytica]GIG66700.1 hypothetical protein Pen01_29950 [Phytomonospora endophytica]
MRGKSKSAWLGWTQALEAAADWIESAYLEEPASWPTYAGSPHPSVWGGTVDGVRAYVALNKVDDPQVHMRAVDPSRAIDWIMSQQLPDGSFPSVEFQFAGVESTAWPLILFRECRLQKHRPDVTSALTYLEGCVQLQEGGWVSTTPKDGTFPRVMPTALCLWAFSVWGHEEKMRLKMIEYLFSIQDTKSHGWGVSANSVPTPASTAQVICALRAANVPVSLLESAIEYLIDEQGGDGGWPVSVDEWHTTTAPGTIRCYNAGTAWGLYALAGLPLRKTKVACAKAADHLARTQTAWPDGDAADRGSWSLNNGSNVRHIWLASQNVLAFDRWISSLGHGAATAEIDRLYNGLYLITRWSINSAATIVTAGLAVIVLAPYLQDVVTAIGINWDSVRDNLVAGGLIAIATGVLSWIARIVGDRIARRR